MAPGINLRGKHVFIAGGSRGIGAASAKILGRAGAKVSLTFLPICAQKIHLRLIAIPGYLIRCIWISQTDVNARQIDCGKLISRAGYHYV